MVISSSIVTLDAEEYDKAGVSEFTHFNVAVSFGVVVENLGVVEGDNDFFERFLLVGRLVLSLFLLLFVVVYIVYFLVVILIVFSFGPSGTARLIPPLSRTL